MGLTQTLRGLDARLNRYAVENLKAGIGYPNPGWAPPPGYYGATSSGVVVNEDRANTVAAWFAGVRKISQDVAKAPLHVYRREGRNAEKALDHPLYRLLHDAPNPEMTSMVFRETLQAHALAWGNGYAEKELNAQGRTIGLWPLRPDRMEAKWEGGKRVYYYTVTAGAKPIRMSSDRIFHLPGLGFDGLVGYSVLRYARETLGAAINLRDYGNRVVRNDARPGTVLTHPATLSDTARKNIKDSWVAANAAEGPGRTALLEEGITLTTFGFPPEDVQFLESQQWQVTEVARWLDIAPHKIGDLSRATFSNIEEATIDHVVSTLGAWFVRWEQQLNKDVIALPDMYCEHNLDAALRGKTLERAQANVLKINAGAMVPNEWRAQDNQNPLDWGDDRVNTPNNTAAGTTPTEPQPDPNKGLEVLAAALKSQPAVTIAEGAIRVDVAQAPPPASEVNVFNNNDDALRKLSEDITASTAPIEAAVGDVVGMVERLSERVEQDGKALAAVTAAVVEAEAERKAAPVVHRTTQRVEYDANKRIVAVITDDGVSVTRKTIHRDADGAVVGTVEEAA